MSWQSIAERAAKARCAAVMARLQRAIAEHAADARVEADDEELRVSGRGLKQRWLSDAGLRFARRIGR